MHKYEISMDRFTRGFTIVTDGDAVMASVANTSVSHEIHNPEETWLRCTAHAFNNVMKNILSSHRNGTVLEAIALNVRNMKKIIENGTGRIGTICSWIVSNWYRNQKPDLVLSIKLLNSSLNRIITSRKCQNKVLGRRPKVRTEF